MNPIALTKPFLKVEAMKSAAKEYKQKVWDFLNEMKPGERYIIDEICERENNENFVDWIKEWMDALPYQGGLSFNHDYTEFYMSHLPESAL